MSPNPHHSKDPRPEHVLLDLGPGVGALVLRTGADLHGKEIEISPAGRDEERSHKQVHERPIAGRPLYGAVFDSLPAGEYTLWLDDQPLRRHVAVAGAAVTDLSIKEEHE
ncbi:MAG TPA: phospholipase [Acidimicrobiia bacterium]|nr:phospholipase [Acidimicrobiia bacterium]